MYQYFSLVDLLRKYISSTVGAVGEEVVHTVGTETKDKGQGEPLVRTGTI